MPFTESQSPESAIANVPGLAAHLGKGAPVIYGMGGAGRHLLKLLGEAGVPVAACIDQDASHLKEVDGFTVRPLEDLAGFAGRNDIPIVVAVNSRHMFGLIAKDLRARFPAITSLIWSRDIVDHLAVHRCHGRLDRGEGVRLYDCMACRADAPNCSAFQRGAKSAAVREERAPGKRSKLIDFAYFATSYCTLNCTHCIVRIPFFEEKRMDGAQKIVSTIRKVCEASEFIYRLSLSGGEVLLLKDLAKVVEELLEIPNLGYIYIYTSGTVIPKPELARALQHPRVTVNISDYGENAPGKLQSNLNGVVEMLSKHDVSHRVMANKTWFDLGEEFEDLGLSVEEMKKSFSQCSFANCMTISDGVLFRCPRQLAGVQQQKIVALPDETVDIDRLQSQELVDALDRFCSVEYIDACGSCLLSVGAKQVKAAHQTPRGKAAQAGISTRHADDESPEKQAGT